MAGRVKRNTPKEVLRRIGKSTGRRDGNIRTLVELSPTYAYLTEQLSEALTDFFQKGYEVPFAHSTKGLEEILAKNGQVALDALEGVARLSSKIVLAYYNTENPQDAPIDYVRGTLDVLSGVPLNQLGSTHDKDEVPFNEKTYRDRISRLISHEKSREPTEKYMAILLRDMLPEAAKRIRERGQQAYLQFLDRAFEYLDSVLEPFASYRHKLPSLEDVKTELSNIEQSIVEAEGVNGSPKLTPDTLAKLARSTNMRKPLEELLGSKVVAVGYSSHHSGASMQVIILTGNRSAPARVLVDYGSSKAPLNVVEGLIRIQQECETALKPNDPAYGTNLSGRNLHHLGR